MPTCLPTQYVCKLSAERLRNSKASEDFIIPVSDTRAYKQFGNSVAVPVIRAIAKNMIATMTKLEECIRVIEETIFEQKMTDEENID